MWLVAGIILRTRRRGFCSVEQEPELCCRFTGAARTVVLKSASKGSEELERRRTS